ncbi:MAG: hypothetical protein Q9165_003810 [Trypethelium subeluteriae]
MADDLLKPVSTVTIRKKPENSLPTPDTHGPGRDHRLKPTISSPEAALEILKDDPRPVELFTVLKYLKSTRERKDDFNIRIPEPRTTQIVHLLVHNIIPSYWSTFELGGSKFSRSSNLDTPRHSLIECLRSLPGIGTVITRLKLLVAEVRQEESRTQAISELLDVLQEVLGTLYDDLLIACLYYDKDQTKRTIFWKEVIDLRASGKIVSIAAQAEDSIKSTKTPSSTRWIASGSQYAGWLGRQLADMLIRVPQDDATCKAAGTEKMLAQLAGKSLSMGYPNDVIRELLKSYDLTNSRSSNAVGILVQNLRLYEQFQFIDTTVSILAENYSSNGEEQHDVSGAAGLISLLVGDNEGSRDHLVERLVQEGPRFYDDSTFSLRVLLAIISEDEDRAQQVIERSMRRFGDKLYIKHTPSFAQEALAQVILLSAGYVHRKNSMFLFTIARSSIHTTSISNRLNATSSRARFLGMVVGTAVSQLVDKGSAKLSFDVDELDTNEAKWYQQLTSVQDKVGDSTEIQGFLESKWPKSEVTLKGTELVTKPNSKSIQKNSKSPTTTDEPRTTIQKPVTSRIQIIDDDDDDLIPYAKPDSDPSDDDEDPFLVTRNRPSAPVYIRDLIAALHDTDSHDRHVLALRTAPSLIRRKTHFGKEVSDHVVELANLFAGLGDHFELADFATLRLQSLVAVLVAQPREMGRWFAKAFFEGDYSISQRGAILSAVGLGAREMAGLESGEELVGKVGEMKGAFPSKRLPERFHRLYGGEEDPVGRESKRLERGLMEPIALSAADKLAGPNALKVRTFSSRMEVEKKRKKPVSNELGRIVADSLFFPLAGSGGKSIQSSPHLLPLYLRTLSLILHAAGPSSPSLPSMTSEFFDLLLGLRSYALKDENVLEALLFAILMILDLNAGEDAIADGGRRLCTEMGKEILEMQVWVEGVFEALDERGAVVLGMGSKGNKDKDKREENRVGMLAAGVLSRIGEIVSKFQSAYITLTAVVLAYVGGQVDEDLLGPVDIVVLRVKPFPQRKSRLHATLRAAILVLSDQQMVTGIAIMGAGFNGLIQESISVYHFQTVLYLAWMSSSVHLSALTILATYLNNRKALKAWRLAGMATLLVLLIIGLIPTASNDWGIEVWDSMPAGHTGWGIPAHCFWFKTWGDGVNPDAVLGFLILIVSYMWKVGALFTWSRKIFYRCVRYPLDWLLEKMVSSLAKRYAKRRKWIWLWLFRTALSIYLPLTALLEVAASFSASVWLSALGLAFGTMEIVIPRAQNMQATGEEESAWSFGQLVPLILLVQPLGAVLEHVWIPHEDRQGSQTPVQRRTSRDENHEPSRECARSSKRNEINLLQFFRNYYPPSCSQRDNEESNLHQLLFASRLFAAIVWFIQFSILGAATVIFTLNGYTIGNGSAGNWAYILLALGIFTLLVFGGTFAVIPFSRLGAEEKPKPCVSHELVHHPASSGSNA